MIRKLPFSSLSLLFVLILLTSCKEESTSVELEDLDVYIQIINNSEYDINYLQAVFETNYGEFYVHNGDLKSGEKTEPILLPPAAHDVKRSHINSELVDLEGINMNFAFEEYLLSYSNIQFIGGTYYYVIDLDYDRVFDGWYNEEPQDYATGVDYGAGDKRLRIKNTGTIDFKSVELFYVREECEVFPLSNDCRGRTDWIHNSFEKVAEFGSINSGEFSSYETVARFKPDTYRRVVTVLGDTLIWYPTDTSFYQLEMDAGAYSLLMGYKDRSYVSRSWDESRSIIYRSLDPIEGD